MRTIHKYPFGVAHTFSVPLPVAHEVVHVDMQGDAQPTMWVEVDTSTDTIPFEFHVVGTGHQVPNGTAHVGTVQMDVFVWHLYENMQFRQDVRH